MIISNGVYYYLFCCCKSYHLFGKSKGKNYENSYGIICRCYSNCSWQHKLISYLINLMSPWTEVLNWMYIRRSEDVSDVFWTSNLRLVYILCSEDALRNSRRNYAYKVLSLLKLNLCDTPELHPEFHQISKVELFESRFDLLKTVSFCRKKLHLRYLTAFYISFCTGESTPSNQAWEVSNLIISRKCIQFYLHSTLFYQKTFCQFIFER